MTLPYWDILRTAGLVLVCIILAAYLILPALFKFQMRVNGDSPLEPVMAESLPADVRSFIGNTVNEFAQAGFRAVANGRQGEDIPGVTSYVVLFVNDATHDMGTALFAIATAGIAHRRVPTVGIQTRYADGTSVVTRSFASGIFPRDPSRNVLAHPAFTNVALSAEVHRRRRTRLDPPGVPAVPPPAGRECEYFQESTRAEMRRVAAVGYYALDAGTGGYRATWKGAYLMTWKLLFPVDRIRSHRMKAKARTQLRELGMDPGVLDR